MHTGSPALCVLSPVLHGPYLHSLQLQGDVVLLVDKQSGDGVGYAAWGSCSASSMFSFVCHGQKA